MVADSTCCSSTCEGHGQSDPSRLYLGRRERGDIRAAMDWAESEGFRERPIGWLGYSMGGSTLLMEGCAKRLGFRFAVIDSPYGDLPRLLETQLSKQQWPAEWFNPGILLACPDSFTAVDEPTTSDSDPFRQILGTAAAPADPMGNSDTTVAG